MFKGSPIMQIKLDWHKVATSSTDFFPLYLQLNLISITRNFSNYCCRNDAVCESLQFCVFSLRWTFEGNDFCFRWALQFGFWWKCRKYTWIDCQIASQFVGHWDKSGRNGSIESSARWLLHCSSSLLSISHRVDLLNDYNVLHCWKLPGSLCSIWLAVCDYCRNCQSLMELYLSLLYSRA